MARVITPDETKVVATSLFGWDVANSKCVFIKTEPITPKNYERLKREIEIGQKLNHPHFVRIIDVGITQTNPKRLYWVAAWINGKNLLSTVDTLRDQGQWMTDHEIIKIGLQIAEALSYLHTILRVVHRDLKLANVMRDDNGDIFVVDLGLAEPLNQSGHANPEWIGPVPWIQPEIARNVKNKDVQTYTPVPYTPNSDLYNLGMILYTLKHQTLPYTARTDAEFIDQSAAGQAHECAIRKLNNETTSLNQLIANLLHSDPDQRPTSDRVKGDLLKLSQQQNQT